MPINSVHPQYECNVKDWCKIENVVKGKVCQYVEDIEVLYPTTHPYYDPNRNYIARISCRKYREGGILSNFAAQTVDVIVGLATQCPPVKFELPPQLEYLKEYATGNNLNFDQLVQYLLEEVIKKGRVGLMTDFPSLPTGMTKEQQLKVKARPYMYTFPAEGVINWDTTDSNGTSELSLVVIPKCVRVSIPGDRFAWKKETQYLVLEMIDGVYWQYQLDKSGKTVIQPFTPKANGKVLNYIPFSFIGAKDNNPCVDAPPLKSIVEMNIGHYRNSCIYEDNLRKYGRGTLNITSDLPPNEWEKFYKNRPLVLGTDEGYFFGANGGMQIVQLQPAQEAAAAMEQKQRQLIMLGAHIVIENPSNVSEVTTKLNMGKTVSQLHRAVGNVEDALKLHFGYCADFLGDNRELVEFELSKEFIEKVADPLVMAQLLAQFNAAAIPASVLLDYDKSVKLLSKDVDYKKLQAEIDNANPLGGSPDPLNNNGSNYSA